MKKIFIFFAASSTISISFANTESISSTKEKEKQPALIFISGGGALSAIDFSRYSGGPRYWGYNFRGFGDITPYSRISFEFSRFPSHRLVPDWSDIKTWNADLNFHFSFAMKNDRTSFYALTGIDYNNWEAQYISVNIPEKNYKKLNAENYYRLTRVGANFGTGFLLQLNEFGLLTEMRFCLAPSPLNTKLRIMDVVYSLGLTYGIPMPQKKNDDKSKKKSFGMPGGIYKWIKKGTG